MPGRDEQEGRGGNRFQKGILGCVIFSPGQSCERCLSHRAESSKKNPSCSPDCSHLPTLLLGDPKSEAGRAARTWINHLIECFLITNPVFSASAAVACPAKRHESQGIPQQQPWLIKVRISVVGFLRLMAGTTTPSYPLPRGMLLAVPLAPQVPGVCFTFPGHLTSCGHSQHHCLTAHVPCMLWLVNATLAAERGEGHQQPLHLRLGDYGSPRQLPDGARDTSSLLPSCTLLVSGEQGVGV